MVSIWSSETLVTLLKIYVWSYKCSIQKKSWYSINPNISTSIELKSQIIVINIYIKYSIASVRSRPATLTVFVILKYSKNKWKYQKEV